MERKSTMMHFLQATAEAPVADSAYKAIVDNAPPKAIETDEEHRRWRSVLGKLMAQPEHELTTAEVAYIKTIAQLIEAYEKARYPLPEVSPAEVLAELMAANNLKQKDLVDVFGSEAAVSYVLHRRRKLTPKQIRGLAEKFHVSPALFL